MASSSGLYASFLPKPLQTRPGSGLHLAVSINKNGRICSAVHRGICRGPELSLAGVLQRAAENDHLLQSAHQLVPASRRVRSAQVHHLVTPEQPSAHHRAPLATTARPNRFKLRCVRRLHQPVHRICAAHPRRSGRHRDRTAAVRLRARKTCSRLDEVRSAPDTRLCPAPCARRSAPHRTATLSQNTCPKRCAQPFSPAKQAEHDRIALADDRTAAERQLYFERY